MPTGLGKTKFPRLSRASIPGAKLRTCLKSARGFLISNPHIEVTAFWRNEWGSMAAEMGEKLIFKRG
ncbi:TPA: hypothetical protein EYP66_26000 [Candidatus Poribacteria bacterium]|nr:hypothetical protein [Candidatus Poribacteria bacterium]